MTKEDVFLFIPYGKIMYGVENVLVFNSECGKNQFLLSSMQYVVINNPVTKSYF